MKKKLVAALLSAALVLTVTACGNTKPAGNESNNTATEQSMESSTEESSEETSTEVIDEATEETSTEVTDEATEETSTEVIDETTKEASEESSEELTEESTVEATDVTEESLEEIAESAPSLLSDDLYSFQMSVDGVIYQFPMWYSDFEALGWSYKNADEADTNTLTSNQYTTSEVWKKDGFTVYAPFANLSMNAVPFSKAMVAGITFDKFNLKDCTWEIKLPKGIQYGVSTKDDIITAYGTPSSDYDGENYYKMEYKYDTYQTIELYVYKDTGVLEQIKIRNITELEGADNSIDATIPEIVKNYIAPAELGTDLYQFNFELEGKLYKLPCPVSQLLANGFTYNAEDTNTEIAAGSFGWIELKYNNQTYRAIARNHADYATVIENCFLTSMKSSIHDPDFALTIPCSITRGMSEDDLLKALEGFHYETDESSSFKYYKVWDPNGRRTNYIEIVVKDGEVAIIELQNDVKPQ